MRVMDALRAAGGLALAVAACKSPAQVTIVNATPGACGQVTGETNLKLTAYTPAGEVANAIPPGAAVTLANLPGDTEQLGVEVLGGNGAIALAGKTAPLDFATLPDDSELPVFVAPPDGFCATGALNEARGAPLIALAGDGVLIAGGVTPDGPSSTAERYDYATASFLSVAVPELADPTNGLAGGVLTSLPDGRVLLTGAAREVIAIYDPATHTFDDPGLFDQRAFHGAIAVDDGHVLVAGGCAAVTAAACGGLALRSSLVYALADVTSVPGPELPVGAQRIGALFYDTGAGYVLAGGSGDFGVADRYVLGAQNTTTITGLRGAFASLDGGALLSADGGGTLVIPPTSATAVTVPVAPDGDATLVGLEDGHALAIGSDRELYDPTSETWTAVAPAGDGPGALVAPVAQRLPDGSVLVLGATPPTTSAWIYRPSLVGPSSGSVVVVPGAGQGVMTAPDPATLAVTGYQLTATATDLDARALIGGTRMATGSLQVAANVGSGGVALIARQVAPGDALVARLVPGAAAELDDLASRTTVCTGAMVAAFAAGVRVELELDVDGSSATLLRDGEGQLSCGVPDGARGQWGVAAIAGGVVSVLTATVTRRP